MTEAIMQWVLAPGNVLVWLAPTPEWELIISADPPASFINEVLIEAGAGAVITEVLRRPTDSSIRFLHETAGGVRMAYGYRRDDRYYVVGDLDLWKANHADALYVPAGFMMHGAPVYRVTAV